MCLDRQLVEVVLVRAAARPVGAAGVLVVIHACVLRAPVGRGVAETERVTHFLAHHVAFLGGGVAAAEVGVVHLRRSPGDMNGRSADRVDRGQPEPAVRAVGVVADPDRVAHG